jgi:thioredoxin 1
MKKIGIVTALVIGIGLVLWSQYRRELAVEKMLTDLAPSTTSAPATQAALPRLLDLGSTECIPCRMMAPILAELAKEYKGRMQVEFIDVWRNREAGEKYNFEVIPTQIFFDESGQEIFRHEGFFSKQDILAKWEELGIVIEPVSPTSQPGNH